MSPPSDFPWAPTIGIGLPVGAFAAGFIKTKSGKRVWDYYFTSLRHLEGTIPMGMFQTFHLSEALSPFAAPETIELLVQDHPELFQNRGFRDYLSRTTGKRISELEEMGVFKHGLSWKKTGSAVGELSVKGGKVIATEVAAVSTGARRSGFLIEWLGHVMGVKNPAFLKDIKETADSIRPEWLFAAGGKSGKDKGRLLGRYGYAIFSSAVGRMNLLLKSPFDLEIVEDWVQKAPILKGLNLGVKPGPAHKVLWRYTKKGALAFGAYKALDYADYLGREYGVAGSVPAGAAGGAMAGLAIGLRRGGKGGRYALYGAVAGGLLGIGGEGPLSSLASAYANVRITQAQIADVTGLGAGARKTEDFFPGLSKPSTLVATAALGMLLGGTYDWGEKLRLVRAAGKRAGGIKPGGKAARGIYEQVDQAVEARRRSLYEMHQARAAKQTGAAKLASEIKSRWYGRVKGKEFKQAGAGRIVAAGILGYEALNIVGSAVAGDYEGAAFMTAATAAAGYAYAKKGGVLGFGILALAHLLREKEDPEKLKRIYSGEEKVAIRSGRWWEMGRTPYEGKRPYYRPHRVALIRSGAEKAALYGSEEAYWDTDPLLHPIDFLVNPYAREELMWEQGYKFPVSRTPFEDAPVLGPVLAATIGRIIKPPKFMGKDEWLPEKLEQGPAGMMESPSREPIMRAGLKGAFGEQMYRLTELVGLPGFAAQSIKESLTGSPTFFEEDQWATPSLVSGAEPTWWNLEMGGLGMLSEGIRRYIPHRRNEIDYKNPLPSGLPSWLPGADSGYFLDFSRGDIYTKVKEAPIRLPGKGLASLNPELQGIDPEYYSDFWRFKVLADVAPWSKEFGQYNRIMSKMAADSRLTAEQQLEVHTIRKQVEQVKKAKRFQQYRYGEAVEQKKVRIVEELEPGVYLTDTFGTAPIVLAGVDTSTVSLANIARLSDASLTARQSMRAGDARRVQAADFLRDHIRPGSEVDVFVHSDPSSMMERGPDGRPQVAAVVSVGGMNINRALVERGLAESMADGEALDPMMATSGVRRAFGNFWENLTHNAETPLESFTPLAPVAKFVHQRTALEEYQRADVYGKEVALWQKPIEHFIAPGLTTTAWWAGWRGIPREVQERYMVEEYFDRLEYEKWDRLQRKAAAEGDARLAAKYQRQARRTKTGANILSEFGARRALSSRERAYFKEFVEAPTTAERREISRVVSPQLRKILHAQWARRASEGARMRQEAGIGIDGDLAAISRFDAMRSASQSRAQQQEIQEAQEAMPVPGPNWLGWDPNSEIEDYKVKTILDKDMDAASYGVWRSDIARVARRPWVQSLAFDEPDREMISPSGARRRFAASMGMSGHRLPYIHPRASGNSRMEFTSPGHDRLHRYMNDPTIMQF